MYSQNHRTPNFEILLLRDPNHDRTLADTDRLIKRLKFRPQYYRLFKLYYEQWSQTLQTLIQLWEFRLASETLGFVPSLRSYVSVPSDKTELDENLTSLFLNKLNSLLDSQLVEKWQGKLRDVVKGIDGVRYKLSRPNKVGVCDELLREKKGLESERDLVVKRISEFKNAIKCLIRFLDCKSGVEKEEEEGVSVFEFLGGEINWEKVYWMIVRECRRLDDGLPIYAFRRDILNQIHRQQITVLIGETGSGKSTQLVQFLADSGICGQDSIICTQPRKLAAISLTERVKEECYGLLVGSSVVCYPSYSSAHNFNSKVIFMTDHCLLQYYMSDKLLSRVSCIIVDEAHERSLNTDLLLALIRDLLCRRPDLRLIIMSATVDANQFADYFCGCTTYHVAGRNYSVDIKYVPCELESFSASSTIPSYVNDVVRVATDIHMNEKNGSILAFLTSQMEVELACEKFKASSAIALPLHGKLSFEDQKRVFLNYTGKRKVIFTTNIAETSLTIPGVKYVVDSGMVKDSKFEPATGMNVLRVCRISKSSANQRAGRAGRTEPGTCYRLYSENEFQLMPPHQEPEIRKVHLGVAVLRILALGIKNVQSFDFVDSPSVKAVDMAIRNLIQLGAVVVRDDVYELTREGREMVKLGIEPRLCKMILLCFHHRLGKEGLVLAAVMANCSSIFCRVGTEEDKSKSDRIKVKFCHQNGDLFTLLSVYKEWESLPPEKRNSWCWNNSINAKSMRRCQDTVVELEACLQNELRIIVPNYWCWKPQERTEHDKTLRNIILTSLAENVAMYSGYDHLGYQVASSGKHVQLHPSCSLLNFGERPPWVVFGEILSVSNEYLVCVTACEFEYFSKLSPPPAFDFSGMGAKQLQKRLLTGFGSVLLKRFCGKFNANVRQLVSRIRSSCGDERVGVEVNVDQNEILLYASSRDMEIVQGLVNEDLDFERKLLRNECMEKCLSVGGSSVALFGAGAEVKHLELEKRHLTVEVHHSNISSLSDKELLAFLERETSGNICSISKFSQEKEKWGRVTFLTSDAAKKAVELNNLEFSGGLLNVVPSRNIISGTYKFASSPCVIARIDWPRRQSKGTAIVKCDPRDFDSVFDAFSNLLPELIGLEGRSVRCNKGTWPGSDAIIISGLSRDLFEDDLYPILSEATNRQLLDLYLTRFDAKDNPPIEASEEAILREISPFMPRSPNGNFVRVEVFPPKEKDAYVRARIMFDGTLHLEAAKALEQLHGKVLPGCQSWQKLRCKHIFQSSVFCPAPVYSVVKGKLDSLIAWIRKQKGAECNLEINQNGSCRVKISACATKTVVELRRPLEQLMKGSTIEHPDITPSVLQVLFTRDGITLMKSIQLITGTYIFFDKHNISVRVFGLPEKIEIAEQRLVNSLLSLKESKQLEIHLRGPDLPPDMMKRVVQNYGPDLHGLKEKLPEGDFSLNTRRHSVSIVNGPKELKNKVEEIINVHVPIHLSLTRNDKACPICLCDVEDSYSLEGCCHDFCRPCLINQCESAIMSRNMFPLLCTKQGCGTPILLADLRTLLSGEKLEELFRASLGSFVAGSCGAYRFCPSPDCPSVYRVAEAGQSGELFTCGACFAETCTGCHLEYHAFMSCENYLELKENPDSSLEEWRKGKEDTVKKCPACGFTIEKIFGCDHMECRCGNHVCWSCLESFASGDACVRHLNLVHGALM